MTATQNQIEQDRADLSRITAGLIRNPSHLPSVLNGLATSSGSARFKYAKVLLLTSEQAPGLLYPHFSVFEGLLDDENQIIRWNAIRILANLASVDIEGRIERLLPQYLAFIEDPVMITAANVIAGAARIALAKPKLTARVTVAILRVEEANYHTRECRNVAIGYALKALRSLDPAVARQPDVLAFAQRQRRNPRNATRKQAADLLRRSGLA